MQRRVLNATRSAKNTAAVSPGVRVGQFLFTSGLGPQDSVTGAVDGDIVAQTRVTLEKISSVLRDGGLGLADVVKVTVHLQDIGDFAAFDATYREFFSEPYPARTTVESGLLGILVEIDAVACASSSQ